MLGFQHNGRKPKVKSGLDQFGIRRLIYQLGSRGEVFVDMTESGYASGGLNVCCDNLAGRDSAPKAEDARRSTNIGWISSGAGQETSQYESLSTAFRQRKPNGSVQTRNRITKLSFR